MIIIFQMVNIILSRNMLNDNNKRGFRLLIGNDVYYTVYISINFIYFISIINFILIIILRFAVRRMP